MTWNTICKVNDIIENSGACALINGKQVAIFRLKTSEGEIFYGIENYDPFSKANVLSRGIIGSISGKTVVASPIYKQHFDLATGQCLEDDSVTLKIWRVKAEGDEIQVLAEEAVAA